LDGTVVEPLLLHFVTYGTLMPALCEVWSTGFQNDTVVTVAVEQSTPNL